VKVHYGPRAVADLTAIADFLTERSPQGARAVERAIRATLALVSDFPGCGRAVEQRPHVRVIPVTRYPYLIFYTVTDDAVVVLHVRHAARRPVEPRGL
jgi:plasmid stabilization system protein ParE